jgi:hypothetical protein
LLRRLAGVGLVFCILPANVVGLPLCLVAWMLASRDLAKIRAGLMDRGGRWEATDAREAATLGMIVTALYAALGVAVYLLLVMGLPPTR